MEKLVQLFEQFKTAINQNNLPQAKTLLSQLKSMIMFHYDLKYIFFIRIAIELAKFNFLVPDQLDNSRFLLAREVLEYAVLLSVKEKDPGAFERHIAQLKAYYSDTRPIAESERKWLILGLNLLRLLAYNRIADFHIELETIPIQVQQSSVYVRHAVQLEQWLMEGSYAKLFEARLQAPADSDLYFMDILQTTARNEIASCIEKAYLSLHLDDATKLIRLSSREETVKFAQQRNWTLIGDELSFQAGAQEKKPSLPAMEVIHQTLNYAKELERIV